ncbi:ankyrin, partial [Sarocladium strictum]
LLRLGAPANKSLRNGETPLHCAWSTSRQTRNNMAVIAQTLHSHGADASLVDNEGKSPLHYAAENALLGVVKVLIESFGADVNATDTAGNTPLFSA